MNEWEDQGKQGAEEPEEQERSVLFKNMMTDKDDERKTGRMRSIQSAAEAAKHAEERDEFMEIFRSIFEEMEKKEKEEREKTEKKKQKKLMQVRRVDSSRLNVKDPPFQNFRVRPPRRRRSRR